MDPIGFLGLAHVFAGFLFFLCGERDTAIILSQLVGGLFEIALAIYIKRT